jgi:hypothetical protein
MAFDLKTATPDTSLPATGFLFGADSQGATDPSIYSVQALRDALLGSGAGVNGATVTTSAPLLNLAQTWNAGGVTFTGWLLNVTDTASAAASKLFDFQVGGASRLSLSKANTGPRLWIGSSGAIGAASSSLMGFYDTAGNYAFGVSGGIYFPSGKGLSFESPGFAVTSGLYYDASGAIGQRQGATAQGYNLYGTYTNSTNYRRVALAMTTTGVATLKPEGLGTGASDNVLHISGLPIANPGAGILWNDAGVVKVGT